MQITPLRACPCDPENAIQNKAVIRRRATALAARCYDKRLKERPLFVRHQTSNHNRLRKSDYESEIEPIVNPLCQQDLAILNQDLNENISASLTALYSDRRHFSVFEVGFGFGGQSTDADTQQFSITGGGGCEFAGQLDRIRINIIQSSGQI